MPTDLGLLEVLRTIRKHFDTQCFLVRTTQGELIIYKQEGMYLADKPEALYICGRSTDT